MFARLCVVLFCFGCGGSSANPSESATTNRNATGANDVCWPVAPMRLVALEHGAEWEPIAEMTGDGSIYSLKKGGRKFAGRVSNDALLDAHETPSLSCVHREVGLPGVTNKGHYDMDDTYVDGSTRIAIANDGVVSFNGRSDGHVKIEGPLPKARRTAVLLVIAALAQ